MNLITWNSNGAFRNKYHLLNNYDYDILIIQECEKKLEFPQEWTHYWIGKTQHKGLGIFCKPNIYIEKLDWSDNNIHYKNEQLQLFLPCLINNEIILIAVWTKKADSEVFGYIGQLWKYLQLHKEKLKNKKVIIAGDFNSNTQWDKWDRWWNHSDVVKELHEIGIESLYHYITQEQQGNESQPTFFLHRKIEKSYHIDYVFASATLINQNTEITLGNGKEWLEHSDHVPIFCKIDLTSV